MIFLKILFVVLLLQAAAMADQDLVSPGTGKWGERTLPPDTGSLGGSTLLPAGSYGGDQGLVNGGWGQRDMIPAGENGAPDAQVLQTNSSNM